MKRGLGSPVYMCISTCIYTRGGGGGRAGGHAPLGNVLL